MRLPIMVLVAGILAGSACASTPRARTFQDLPRSLHSGDRIRVHPTDGSRISGSLEKLTPTGLTIRVDGASLVFPDATVWAIDKAVPWKARGALVGLLVGGTVGLVAARSREPSGNPLLDTYAGSGDLATGLLVGAGLGTLIGALIKVDRNIFRAPLRPQSESASAPAASRRGSP